MKMKAAIYYGPGDIRIEEVERPKVRPEGVVLRVKACGICAIMDFDAWIRQPTRIFEIGRSLGHEYSGEVVEVGSQVTIYKVGDRIYGNPVFRPCYGCEACRVKDYWRCTNWMEGMQHWAFAEYLEFPFVTNESSVKLPDTLSYHDLALIEPLYLGVGLAKKAKADDVVVVLGQDLIGLGTVAYLKEMGVAKVIASDVSKKRLDAAREVGADVVVDDIKEDVVKVVMKETAGEGADVVIVSDHRPIALSQAIDVVQRAGVIWLATMYNAPFKFDPALWPRGARWFGPHGAYQDAPLTFDPSLLSMQTAWGTLGARVPRWLEAAELIKSGKITAKKHVTHVFPLDKIKEAFETAINPHESIKVIVEP